MGAYTDSPGDSSPEFEKIVVDYMWKRVDEWIQDLQKAIRKAKKSRLCYHQQHGEDSVAQVWARMMELVLRFDADKTDCETRLSIVKHAYICVNMSEVQDLLSDMFGMQTAQKLWGKLLFIARPLVDSRLLRSIAAHEAQFQNCRFTLVPSKPKTVLDARYVIGLFEAWEQLGLGSVPQSLATSPEINQSFKEKCAEPFSLHAEMRLILLYNEGHAPQPTMDYFGCSKKSCLLCETFLAALPNPIDTRGRHGVCYPAWGVPVSNSATIQNTLEHLRKSLMARIRGLLDNGARKVLIENVLQSDFVSSFSDLTLEERRQKKLDVRQYNNSQMQQQRDIQIK